jgi:hypothetical protein
LRARPNILSLSTFPCGTKAFWINLGWVGCSYFQKLNQYCLSSHQHYAMQSLPNSRWAILFVNMDQCSRDHVAIGQTCSDLFFNSPCLSPQTRKRHQLHARRSAHSYLHVSAGPYFLSRIPSDALHCTLISAPRIHQHSADEIFYNQVPSALKCRTASPHEICTSLQPIPRSRDPNRPCIPNKPMTSIPPPRQPRLYSQATKRMTPRLPWLARWGSTGTQI